MNTLHTKKQIEQYALQKGQIILPTQLILDCNSEDPKVQKKTRLWIELLTRCYHDKTKFRVNTSTIYIEKGEYLTSFHRLSKLLGFPQSTLRRLAKELIDQEVIATRRFKNYTIFAIVNMDLFTHFPSYKNKHKLSFEEEKEKEDIEIQRNIDKNIVYY